MLTVDLLAVVAGNPAAKTRNVLGLIVFDARTGRRLEDRAIAADREQAAAAIRDAVRVAASKFCLGHKAVQTVSLVAIHNVDLGPAREGWCLGVGRLLERGLCRSPQAAVLDRTYLDQVTKSAAWWPTPL